MIEVDKVAMAAEAKADMVVVKEDMAVVKVAVVSSFL